MSTSDEFPQIPTAQELLQEVRDREAAELNGQPENHEDAGQFDESQTPEWNGLYGSAGVGTPPPPENLRAPYPHEIEQFRGSPPYLPVNNLKEQRPGLEELKREYFENSQGRRPTFELRHDTQVVELSPLVKAYARFTNEQTMFLENGAGMTGVEYQQALWRYSKAQTALIRAQAEALRQAGVL